MKSFKDYYDKRLAENNAGSWFGGSPSTQQRLDQTWAPPTQQDTQQLRPVSKTDVMQQVQGRSPEEKKQVDLAQQQLFKLKKLFLNNMQQFMNANQHLVTSQDNLFLNNAAKSFYNSISRAVKLWNPNLRVAMPNQVAPEEPEPMNQEGR